MNLKDKYSTHASDGQASFRNYSGSNKGTKNIVLTDVIESIRQNRDYTQDSINKLFKQNKKAELVQLSETFYSSNAMYMRFVEYFATMYLHYWSVIPKRAKPGLFTNDELTDAWFDLLDYVEAINPERLGTIISREVMIKGEAYIAVKESFSAAKGPSVGIQFLPQQYCRTTKKYGNRDIVDFNVKFFDEKFRDANDRMVALQTMPQVLSEAYLNYKSQPTPVRDSEWVSLDPDYAFRFSVRNDGLPVLISILVDLVDLSDVKDLSMFKLEQEVSKILVQQFKTDKDGSPIVDFPTMQTFHNNTASMLQDHAGVDVITTLAEVSVQDLQSKAETASNNPVTKSTETVYNSAGVSGELMNSTSSGSLNRSIAVDESLIYDLLLQFEEFLNIRINKNVKKFLPEGTSVADVRKFRFRLTVLPVTHYNREQMIKWYKEQTTIGYSKFLPPIALGQRQSDVMSSLYFENDVLGLVNLMQPPVSSNTMSSAAINARSGNKSEGGEAGRPEKSEDERSEKTIANRESL